MSRTKDWLYLALIVLLALLLRLPLVQTGITIDDACTAYVIEASDVADFINRIKTIEMSPPLYFILLKSTVSIFGFTTEVLAMTSVALSVLTIPMLYLLGRASVDGSETNADAGASSNQATKARRVGLCTAFFGAVSLLAIIYSHEARTYALAGLLMTSTLYVYMPFFSGRATWPRQICLFLLTALLAYTHYTSVAYIGIMSLTAIIFRKNGASRSLRAIPPMVAGLATLLPWYPVLKYHSSVGTPWADPTPLIYYPTVFASNASAVMPLPVVSAYLIVTLLVPAALALAVVLKPQLARQKLGRLFHSPKFFTLLFLFIYSASIFGFITPYIFGYVRYMYPIACTGWVLLALLVVNIAPTWTRRLPNRTYKIALYTLLALLAVAASACEVIATARQDRSGLRRLAIDIIHHKFDRNQQISQQIKTTYITTPDFVGIILVYYLKHECAVRQQDLPDLLGFAYPGGGLLPPKHEGRASCWQDPQLISKYAGYLDDRQKAGINQVVLIRDTYTPTSRLIPTREMTDKLEALLRSRCDQIGATEDYKGHASSYRVTRFAFRPRQ